jgi:hypothetical protein
LADGTPAPLKIVFATVLPVRPAAWTVVGEISIVISEINRILITLVFRFEIAISYSILLSWDIWQTFLACSEQF